MTLEGKEAGEKAKKAEKIKVMGSSFVMYIVLLL